MSFYSNMHREYIKYYQSQAGGNINEIGPLLQLYPSIQRGRGLGNLFAGLFRYLKPSLVTGLNFIKDEALKTGANILSDIVSGANPKEVFQDQAKEGLKNLRTSAINQLHSMYGSGRKRKRSRNSKKLTTKKRKTIKRRVKRKLCSIGKKRGMHRAGKKARTLDIFN